MRFSIVPSAKFSQPCLSHPKCALPYAVAATASATFTTPCSPTSAPTGMPSPPLPNASAPSKPPFRTVTNPPSTAPAPSPADLPRWNQVADHLRANEGSLGNLRGGNRFLLALPRQHYDQSRRFVDVHRLVVHQHRVRRPNQWGYLPFPVAPVAFAHFLEHLEYGQRIAFFLVLFPAPFRSHLRRSLQKNLQLRVREDHRADIPALHDHAAALSRPLLLRDQHPANPSDGSESRRSLRHFTRANCVRDLLAIEEHPILCPGLFLRGGRRLKLDTRFRR